MIRAAALALLLAGCTPAENGLFAWCTDGTDPIAAPDAPTYHQHVKPIVDAKCVRCHEPGGIGPLSLRTYDELFPVRAVAAALVRDRHMPPWLADPCCGRYRDDFSLTALERATFEAWVATGAPPGDPAAAPAITSPKVGGLARVDLRLTMPEPYQPKPPPGSTDDVRCFLLDWPVAREVFVTGLEVQPGHRSIVHHLVLAVVSGGDLDKALERDRKDPGPGFSCAGGTGGIKPTVILGGGLAASELPAGYGKKVPPRSKVVLNIHYSTAHTHDPRPDRTSVAFMLADSGKPLKTMAVANPAWIVGDSMKVKAGDPDAVFFYRFRPTLFTADRPVRIHSAQPHMHTFGSKFVLAILRKDGTQDCLLQIPRWDFGWEQPYWLAEPKTLLPGDQVYVECHFDNSGDRQPIVDGKRAAPRDIAWGGNNQDMCAGFMSFAEE